jgi:uncharacterized protein (TIGR03435 family)
MMIGEQQLRDATRWAAIMVLACSLRGQTPAPAFEVASIRPHQDEPGNIQRVGLSVTGSRLSAVNVGIQALIGFAYQGPHEELGGVPGNLEPARYDVQAKAPGDGPLSRDQARLMMQTLLAERAELKVHNETKEAPVYFLRVAKSGAKLKASTSDSPGGMRMLSPTSKEAEIIVSKWTAEQLAGWLSGAVDRQVWDETGLTGSYDFNLKWGLDRDPEQSDPGIFTALQEQLGLRLEAGKGQIKVWVVDHVVRPSGN